MDRETQGADPQWYLLQTRLKQEERANRNLNTQGIETLHAKLKRRVSKFTGAYTYTEPLFPRYILAKFNLREQLRQIRSTPGVRNVVYFGNHPALVHADIIDIIRARIDQNGFVKVSKDFKPEVTTDPLRNLIGIFERDVKGSERNLILLTAIGYMGPSFGS